MEVIEATFVIIGGGIAGVSCAEQLTFLCPEEKILLISATSMIKRVTNLNMVSSILTTFDVEEKDAKDFDNEHPNLSVMQGMVKEINSEKFEIYLEDMKSIVRYKSVILCHGAKPKLLSDEKYIFGIRDTESVQNFQDNLKGAKKIVIVGNGGIATEMVHELKNVEIVWVIKDNSIASTFVDAGAGQFFYDELFKKTDDKNSVEPVTKRSRYTAQDLQKQSSNLFGGALGPDWHSGLNVQGSSEHGKKVTIETDTEIKDITEIPSDPSDYKVSVKLTNDKIINCDFVVSATGVIPNGELIKIDNLALDDNKAIIVNDQMETNIKGIYAAGDVCSCLSWNHSDLWFQMRLWTQARQMGHYAGQCVFTAWKNPEDRNELDFCFEVFTHATKFFGYKVILIGRFNAQGLSVDEYEVLLRVTKGREYVKVVLKDGKMQGALLIGETDLEETFENLILNQMDLSIYGEDLLDPNIDIEDYFD